MFKNEKMIEDYINAIGDNPQREGLVDTPNRVVKSWDELYCGYKQDPESILSTTFTDGICDEMVVLRDIDFYSQCEHHILPFVGRAHIGYIPNKKIVGVSKLARLVDAYARRLQIQERLTTQIADTIDNVLMPHGVMVVIEGKHMCMTMRGVKKENAKMITSAVRGIFKDSAITRSEFMNFIRMSE